MAERPISSTLRCRTVSPRKWRVSLLASLAVGPLLGGIAAAQTLGMVADDGFSGGFLRVMVFNADTDTILGAVAIPPPFGTVTPAISGDCAISTEHRLGFVTTFAKTIWVIDLATSPPSLASGINPIHISCRGEDLSITADGRFLVVADGLTAIVQPISVVDIATRTQVATYSTFPSKNNSAEACSDGSVLMTLVPPTNINSRKVERLSINPSGALASTGQILNYTDLNNVACAPNGVIGAAVTTTTRRLEAFKVSPLADLGSRFLPSFGLSAVFGPASNRVFARSYNHLTAYCINPATGILAPSPIFSVSFPLSVNTLHGIDNLAIHPNGQKLYLPQREVLAPGVFGNAFLQVRDSGNGSLLSSIPLSPLTRPTGVAVAGPAAVLVAPCAIVQACDEGQVGATVNFLLEVKGSVPPGATLRVRDVTGNRVLLEQPAALGTVGVGPNLFPVGVSTVEAEIVSEGTRIAFASFTVQIHDTVAPVLSGCGSKTIECQGPESLIDPALLGITAQDNCDPEPTITLSPAMLGAGTTAVTAIARDATGNASQCTFNVTVGIDATPPAFTACPGNITRECTSPAGATVSFEVAATDLCGQVTISCRDEANNLVDPDGTLFSLGPHAVTCTAEDEGGNAATCAFTVTIVDTMEPVIVCPGDIAVANDLGECSAHVSFSVSATDLCDPNVPVTFATEAGPVQSGDAFPVGQTRVTATAVDDFNNAAACSFNVVVRDLEPPLIGCPPSVTLVTDCAGSPLTVGLSGLGITATDNCDPSPATSCVPTLLEPGTTTVLCTSRDAEGNSSVCLTEVTVLKGPFACQILRPLDGNVDNKINAGQTVPIKLKVTCDNLFQSAVVATVDAIFQVDGEGTPIANESPEDSGLSNDGGILMRLADGFWIYNLSTAGWPSAPGTRFKVVLRVTHPGRVDTVCEVFLVNR